MNVYDFDGTIYDGDSSVDFWLYSIREKPSVFLKCLPELFCGAILYGLKRIPKEEWKEHFFSFLRYLPADDVRVIRFWEQHTEKIKEWYLARKQESDVIISASPVFLLQPISRKLGVTLIATEVDPASGRFSGLNCSGKEKVRRFREVYPDAIIDEFYTDSKKDLPLASIAGKACFVRKNTIREMKTE